jgi:hypothetical protein
VSVNSWSKLAYPTVVDSSNGSTATSASPSTSGTNTYGDVLFLAAVFVAGPTGDTITPDTANSWTGLTRVGTSGAGTAGDDRTINAAWRSVPTAGTYTHAPTLGTSRVHIVQLLSYRAATFTPPPPPAGSGSHVGHLAAATASTSGSTLVLTVPAGGGSTGRPNSRADTNAGLKIPTGSLISPTLPRTGMTGGGTIRNIVAPGTYENFDFPGAVNILANNVTLRNYRWLDPADFWAVQCQGPTGVVIEDCLFDGARVGCDVWGTTVRRCEFKNMSDDPFHIGSASGTAPPQIIEDCLVYDYNLGPAAHGDGVQQWVSGIDNLWIYRCWIETKPVAGWVPPDDEAGFTSPIFLQSYPEPGTQGITFIADCVLDSDSNYAIRFEGPGSAHGAITCRPAAVRNRLRASTETPLIEGGVPFEGEGNIAWDGTPYNHPSQIAVQPGLPDSGNTGVETVGVGQTVILKVVSDFTGAPPSATDSRGNAYTLDKTVTDPANTIRTSVLSGRITTALAAGDTITVAFGSSPTRRAVTADLFDGILHPVLVDRSATAGGSSTTPAVSLSTVNADDLIVAALGTTAPSADTFSDDTTHGWSALTPAHTGTAAPARTIRSVYRSVGAPGTYSYTPTLGTSRAWAVAAVAYKAG